MFGWKAIAFVYFVINDQLGREPVPKPTITSGHDAVFASIQLLDNHICCAVPFPDQMPLTQVSGFKMFAQIPLGLVYVVSVDP